MLGGSIMLIPSEIKLLDYFIVRSFGTYIERYYYNLLVDSDKYCYKYSHFTRIFPSGHGYTIAGYDSRPSDVPEMLTFIVEIRIIEYTEFIKRDAVSDNRCLFNNSDEFYAPTSVTYKGKEYEYYTGKGSGCAPIGNNYYLLKGLDRNKDISELIQDIIIVETMTDLHELRKYGGI